MNMVPPSSGLQNLIQVYSKVHPRTGHEGPDVDTGIAVLFLEPWRWMGWVVIATLWPLYPQ
jgi:hypothetical protein